MWHGGERHVRRPAMRDAAGGADAAYSTVRRPSVCASPAQSVVEPRVAPAEDLTLGPSNTLTEFEEARSQSRVIGGVHFVAATVEAQRMCTLVGDLAFELVDRHIRGVVRGGRAPSHPRASLDVRRERIPQGRTRSACPRRPEERSTGFTQRTRSCRASRRGTGSACFDGDVVAAGRRRCPGVARGRTPVGDDLPGAVPRLDPVAVRVRQATALALRAT